MIKPFITFSATVWSAPVVTLDAYLSTVTIIVPSNMAIPVCVCASVGSYAASVGKPMPYCFLPWFPIHKSPLQSRWISSAIHKPTGISRKSWTIPHPLTKTVSVPLSVVSGGTGNNAYRQKLFPFCLFLTLSGVAFPLSGVSSCRLNAPRIYYF